MKKYPLYADAWREDVPVDELRRELQEIYRLLGVLPTAPTPGIDGNLWDFGTFTVPNPVTAEFGTFAAPTALDVDFGGF